VVEPVGYDSVWQKFDNDVYNVVRKHFQDDNNFVVEWSPIIERYCAGKVRKLTPDVLLSVKCKSCKENNQPSR
jgi:hypothetical protein